jgi:hypothetical protein
MVFSRKLDAKPKEPIPLPPPFRGRYLILGNIKRKVNGGKADQSVCGGPFRESGSLKKE